MASKASWCWVSQHQSTSFFRSSDRWPSLLGIPSTVLVQVARQAQPLAKVLRGPWRWPGRYGLDLLWINAYTCAADKAAKELDILSRKDALVNVGIELVGSHD